MRAIRVGLFTTLLLAIFGAPARADKFDIHTLFGDRRDVGQTLTDFCHAGLCASQSSLSDLEFHTMFSDVEFDTITGGPASIQSGMLSLKEEKGSVAGPGSGGNQCGQKKSHRGRCSEDWQQSHSVPEPGTLLLMGVGMLAGGCCTCAGVMSAPDTPTPPVSLRRSRTRS